MKRDPVKIIELKSSSSSGMFKDAVDLLFHQMKSIGDKKSRKHIIKALEISLTKNSGSHTFLALKGNEVIGLCFFNVCVGIQSGGKYIWINEIFVSQKHRNAGVAKALLDSVEKFAIKNKCVYILAQRDPGNLLSGKLFTSVGFEQSKVMWISKKI